MWDTEEKRQDNYTLPGILNAAAAFTESPVFSLLTPEVLGEVWSFYNQDYNNKIMITSTLVVKISFPTTDNSPSQDCPHLEDNHKIKIYPKVQTIYRIT